MSLASDALSQGILATMLDTAIAGETVTFRSASVSAHINREAGDGTEPPGSINSSTREEVIVLFAATVSEPIPGEIITTSGSEKLRIEHVRNLGYGWSCRCALKR